MWIWLAIWPEKYWRNAVDVRYSLCWTFKIYKQFSGKNSQILSWSLSHYWLPSCIWTIRRPPLPQFACLYYILTSTYRLLETFPCLFLLSSVAKHSWCSARIKLGNASLHGPQEYPQMGHINSSTASSDGRLDINVSIRHTLSYMAVTVSFIVIASAPHILDRKVSSKSLSTLSVLLKNLTMLSVTFFSLWVLFSRSSTRLSSVSTTFSLNCKASSFKFITSSWMPILGMYLVETSWINFENCQFNW